jgi:hypothetical protein
MPTEAIHSEPSPPDGRAQEERAVPEIAVSPPGLSSGGSVDWNTPADTTVPYQQESLNPTPGGARVVTELPRPLLIAQTFGQTAISSETPLLADVDGIDTRVELGTSAHRLQSKK